MSVHQFASLAETQALIEAWWMDDNHHRSHSSLWHLTPNEFLDQCQGQQIVEEAAYFDYGLSRKRTNVTSLFPQF